MAAQPSLRLRPLSPRGLPKLQLVTDPLEAAAVVGLRYVSDDAPGIRRLRSGKGFKYVRPGGQLVRDPATLQRIRALVIPPAWEEVWISAHPNGHVQATGRDARGRKQYRYHARWRTTRDETKFHKMIGFAAALPQVRARIESDLALPGLPRTKVLAAVVRLLELTCIRVGNEEYARSNGSYGLTTLRDRHVEVTGSVIAFRFRGKSGVDRKVDLHDRRLAAIVRKCQDLPGHELFRYIAEDGDFVRIESGDVNAYLHEVAGEEYTAKDFRTWAGTVHAALALEELGPAEHERLAKKNIVEAIRTVSSKLGNTPAVCRRCYVHPAILEGYADGHLARALSKRSAAGKNGPHDLRPEEAAVVAFLVERLG
jgi:DNA topoisomerase-1